MRVLPQNDVFRIVNCVFWDKMTFSRNHLKMTFFRNHPKWHFEQFQILGNEEIVKIAISPVFEN